MDKKLRFILAIAALGMLLAGTSSSIARADSFPAGYTYVIDASSMAPNGMVIDLSGDGTLSIHPKSVTGGGNYTHHFAPDVQVSGTWTAKELLSFVGYGCENEGTAEEVCGGQAVILVHIVAERRLFEGDGILQIDSPIGDSPSGAEEGVRLAVPGALNFNKEVSGSTAFYLLP